MCLWTHPPAPRQPGALGHMDSFPCHPPASSGPGGAWVPGGRAVVNTKSSVTPSCLASVLVLPPAGGPPPQMHRWGGRPLCRRPAGGCGCRHAAASRSSCTPSGGQVGVHSGFLQGGSLSDSLGAPPPFLSSALAQGTTNTGYRDLTGLRDNLPSQGDYTCKYTYAHSAPHDSEPPPPRRIT